jgi:hypothetical protein
LTTFQKVLRGKPISRNLEITEDSDYPGQRRLNIKKKSVRLRDIPDGLPVGSWNNMKNGWWKIMNRILKSLLRTGLEVLDQPDRTREPVLNQIRNTAEIVRRTIRGEDHTLQYVLTFAAGVGVGLGVGILIAPVSGAQSRNTIAGKVREVGTRIKTQSAVKGDFATGTQG